MSSHVFVIDDDPALLRLSSLVLQTAGIEVEPFQSSPDALARLSDPAEQEPAAIVLDLNMPELNGWEFYRRARIAGYHNPVLILSAFGANDARVELGADAALAKPFEPDDLISTLTGLISGGQST